MRRQSFRDDAVDYAAVGSTQAPDLLQYPPEGSESAVDAWLIGSGEERFRAAVEQVLSWVPLKGAGLELVNIKPAEGPTYTGISFDGEGNAITPPQGQHDDRFDADGTPYASAGTTLTVSGRIGGARADAELRVIFVVEEQRRAGFALGTVGGSSVSGEESFMVEWRDNDEVWFEVRAFDHPNSLLHRVAPVMMRRRRKLLFDGYLKAIAPYFRTA